MSSGPRCYMRYGNAGQLYRTCNDNVGATGPPKPPSKFTPLITQSEFLEEIGKPYSKLTDSQRQNYHRLASARSMRERREETRKQATMNEKEYKQYLQSKREDTKSNRENKILYQRKIKEEKELQKNLKNEGVVLGDKKEISDFIMKQVLPNQVKRVESNQFKEDYIKEYIEEGKEDIGTIVPEDIQREVFKKGLKTANKKTAQIKIPTGGTVSLQKMIGDFGLESIKVDLGIGESVSVSKKKADQLIKILGNVGETAYSEQTKKFKGKPETYKGYVGLFKSLMDGKLKGQNPNARGISAEEKKKRKEQQANINQAKEQIQQRLLDTTESDKKLQDLKQSRLDKIDSLEEEANKEFKDYKKQSLKDIEDKKGFLVGVNLSRLEEARNIARKNDFDEKWIEKNINLGIDPKTGQPTNRTDLLNGRLIRAKKILENIEGIDQKLILSREMKRNKK